MAFHQSYHWGNPSCLFWGHGAQHLFTAGDEASRPLEKLPCDGLQQALDLLFALQQSHCRKSLPQHEQFSWLFCVCEVWLLRLSWRFLWTFGHRLSPRWLEHSDCILIAFWVHSECLSESESFQVWTLEARVLLVLAAAVTWARCQGDLIGGAADFVQKICIEQFGIQDWSLRHLVEKFLNQPMWYGKWPLTLILPKCHRILLLWRTRCSKRLQSKTWSRRGLELREANCWVEMSWWFRFLQDVRFLQTDFEKIS